MNDEKERLEKELRFLKESLEANIISEEEYEKGKARIEKRLDELGTKVGEKEEELTVADIKEPEEHKEETASDILEEVEEEQNKGKRGEEQEAWVTKELKELEEQNLIETRQKTKKEKPKVGTEEKGEEETAADILKEVEEEQKEPEEEKKSEEKKPKKTKSKPAKQKKPESEDELKEEKEETKPIKINRKTLRIIAIIAIIIMFILIKRSPIGTKAEVPIEEEFKPVCSTDEECIKSGEVGVCKNPDTKEAICEFYEAKEVELTILGDKTCISCDTSRMLNVLRQLFPGIKKELIDANTPEGRSSINEFNIKVLPAYIFSSDIEETMKFDRFKRALVKKGDSYLVTPTASGSNYFFARPSKPFTMELFVEADQDTTIIDNSMKEVIDLFGGKITFNKQVVQEEDKEGLKKEFAITTYPAYIINNQLKFTGTQASEIIKNRFCYLNNLPECGTTLSLDIVTSD